MSYCFKRLWVYLIDLSEPIETRRLSRKRRRESEQIRILKTADVSRVALATYKNSEFVSPNARISAKPTTQRGRRFRRLSKPAKFTIFRIVTETNDLSLQVYRKRP